MPKNSYCGVGVACIYCKYLDRIADKHIFCKKYYGGMFSCCKVGEFTACGKYKPKKNIKIVFMKGEEK